MRIDYKKLSEIAVDPKYRSVMAKDTSEVLSNYLYLLSNLSADIDKWPAAEMAMITNSLNRWQDKKASLSSQKCNIGDIVMLDFGLNYSPELSYGHPAVILEKWKNIILVVPATSSASKIKNAFHPEDNPNGKWYYRKVTSADGFSHDGVLILNNLKAVSKSAIINPIGRINCDWKNENNLIYEIKRTLLKNMFTKEYIKHIDTLEKLDKALLEIKNLKNDITNKNKQIELLEQELAEK